MNESVNQDQQVVGENVKESELLQNETKENITIPDITREQWFWDKAVPS